MESWHGTTIIGVRKKGKAVIGEAAGLELPRGIESEGDRIGTSC